MTTHAPIVRQIVDRLHVSMSNRAVISYVAGRMKGGRKTFLCLPRETRREIMGVAIKRHRDNLELFYFVMRGR